MPQFFLSVFVFAFFLNSGILFGNPAFHTKVCIKQDAPLFLVSNYGNCLRSLAASHVTFSQDVVWRSSSLY